MPIPGLTVANRFRFNVKVPERELECVIDLQGRLDFDKVAPMPINVYRGAMSDRDRETFPLNWIDWRLANWGTIYGPVNGESRYENDTTICFHFDSHDRPPFPIAAALANRFWTFVPEDWVLEHSWAVLDEFEGISAWAVEYWKKNGRIIINSNLEEDKRRLIKLFGIGVDRD